jgi:hypothetical protein
MGGASGHPHKRKQKTPALVPGTEGEPGIATGLENILDDPLLIRFGSNTWKKEAHMYGNLPLPFTGPELGCTHPYGRLPSILGLFDKFWSQKMQKRIVRESNRYASEVIDVTDGRTRGGMEWTPLGSEEFRAYLSICLLMGLKKLPSTRLYWSRDEPLFHCLVISQTMTRDRYE